MGAGAVGGYLGALLARAGHPVTLIARGDHLRAIRSRGLQVHSELGDFSVRTEATDQPTDVGPVDLVLFTVKTYHNEDAIPQVRPLVSDETTVLALQNGATTWEEVRDGLGVGHVLPGAVYIEAKIEGPGAVRQQGNIRRLVFGEANGSNSNRASVIADMFQQAGMPVEVSGDVLKALWTKWLFIATLAGVTATSRAGLAELLSTDGGRELVVQVLREIEAVGRKRGVNLDGDVVEQTRRYMDNEARYLKASMHTDLELGRPLELEALNGAVVRLGREVGVPTPANETIYRLLKVHDLKHRGLLSAG